MTLVFNRFNFLSALAISIGIHAAICLFFVFTLTPRVPVFQPYFISLGAILESNEVEETLTGRGDQVSQLNDNEIFSGTDKVRLHRAAQLDKPRKTTATDTSKKSKKSLFDANFPFQQPPTKEELEKLGSDIGLEPVSEYAPLRFQTR